MSGSLFPRVDIEAWRARVQSELGDKPFEKLIRQTLEGVAIDPLYVGATGSHAPASSERNGGGARGVDSPAWRCAERISIADPLRGNVLAREAVVDGADVLIVALDAAGRQGVDGNQAGHGELVGKEGMAVVTVADLGTLLAGIDLERITVYFEGGANALPLAALVEASLGASPRALESGRVVVGFDPLGALARDGELPRAFGELTAEMRTFANGLVKTVVSSVPFHAAGASAVTEIGLLVSSYLAARELGGASVVEICASSDVFLTIAKVRALRLVVSKIQAALNHDDRSLEVIGRVSPRSVAERDAHTNMIRVATQAFGLAAGGVDILITSPFDEALGESEASARRTARHTQLVLREEAHLGRVIDPAGGSYYIEALTDDLARNAWKLMQSIEAEGGLLAALVSGSVARRIEQEREARHEAIAKRSEVLVGVNDFAVFDEVKLSRTAPRPAKDGAHARAKQASSVEVPPKRDALAWSDLVKLAASGVSLAAVSHQLLREDVKERAPRLGLVRDAQRFEVVRDEADLIAVDGDRPRVVIACLGSPADYRGRQAFAQRFFETGGMAVSAIDSPDALTTKWIATKDEIISADVVCIAGSNERYGELGQAAVRTIRTAFPTAVVVLAGRATAIVKADTPATPVDLEIYMGCDTVSALTFILQKVRVRRRRAAATTRRLA